MSKPNRLTQNWQDMGHYSAVSSFDPHQALEDTKALGKAIESQEIRNSEHNIGLSRRSPLTSDNGKRYIIISPRNNRVYFQCDSLFDAFQFLCDHPGTELVDLADAEWFDRKMIGKFLGVADKNKVLRREYFVDSEMGVTLLKDRRESSAVIPKQTLKETINEIESPRPKVSNKVTVKNTTHGRVLLDRLMKGQPLEHSNICSGCGYSKRNCMCPKCSGCKEVKPLVFRYKLANGTPQAICKECERIASGE